MSALRIHEIYRSVQGESTFAGLPCVFVRTTGCPLRCVWCDTAYAFEGGETMERADVLARVLAYRVDLVEITGGEPLAQKEVPALVTDLCDAGRTVLIETSGAYPIDALDARAHVIMDIKCPDSGEEARNLWANIEALRKKDEVKFVLASRRDYEYARDAIARHALHERAGAVLLSVVFGALAPVDAVDWMLADRVPARFQLQMHKFIWPPDARGV
ncbi:MAG: radical SAM protein [Deltaproteobacteria bacterium]|nr:radical SAM protein [Deltaproteobacteria bacterium]